VAWRAQDQAIRPVLILFICSVLAVGCTPGEPAAPDAGALVCPPPATPVRERASVAFISQRPLVDDDGDGALEIDGDCDDTDRWVGPAAVEVCDLRDNDCDGLVDEEGCPEEPCPISFPRSRCCETAHTLGGSFLQPLGASWGGGNPFEVLIRRADTGELRRAQTCQAPGEGRFRFALTDPTFVVDGARYELIPHLRWYLPAAVRAGGCATEVLVVETVGGNACAELGALALCR
jgi:hypothetical protein